jgi:hypothetical protein
VEKLNRKIKFIIITLKYCLVYLLAVEYVSCFSGDSFVRLSNGENKQIDSLQIGDEILTIDQSKLISTEVIMMLDKHISKEGKSFFFFDKILNKTNFILALFYVLKTSCDNEISLTGYHLIGIISSQGNINYKIAKQIQIGDLLLNENLKPCPVTNITIQIKKGYYSPLTMKGTLIVNQILASSFAHVKNHDWAQFAMFPIRYYYKLTRFIHLNDPFYIQKSEGLNWFIKIMFYCVRYFQPSILLLP